MSDTRLDQLDARHFGPNLARELRKRGLSREEFAREVGRSTPMPGRWIEGHLPRLDDWIRVAQVLNVDPLELLVDRTSLAGCKCCDPFPQGKLKPSGGGD